MDKRNARKIKKFLMEEFTEEGSALTESNGSLQNTDDVSLPDESSQVSVCSGQHTCSEGSLTPYNTHS